MDKNIISIRIFGVSKTPMPGPFVAHGESPLVTEKAPLRADEN